jgi:hypothetical protein
MWESAKVVLLIAGLMAFPITIPVGIILWMMKASISGLRRTLQEYFRQAFLR